MIEIVSERDAEGRREGGKERYMYIGSEEWKKKDRVYYRHTYNRSIREETLSHCNAAVCTCKHQMSRRIPQ